MKTPAALLVAMLIAASSAVAQDKILADVTGDINGDKVADRVQLIRADDDGDVDLAIYLSGGGKLPAKPTLVQKAFGWTGNMAGQTLAATINARGSLILTFENDAVGRDRWQTRYTIAWREGKLVVAGYTHSERDTLDPKAGRICDINFLTGKGKRGGTAVTVPAGGVTLASWTDASIPKACAF
ncbi:MAG: hypothetical protein ACREFC_01610 [Stellaceae bacterium]